MKEAHIKTLLEKYKNGQTTLEEEKYLFKNKDKVLSPLTDWIAFEQKNKKKVPENLNEKLWYSFDEKTKTKRKILKSTTIAAATIALLFTLYVKNTATETQTAAEKEALLKEAKSLFSDLENPKNKDIIFEDDLIIVYTETIK